MLEVGAKGGKGIAGRSKREVEMLKVEVSDLISHQQTLTGGRGVEGRCKSEVEVLVLINH